MKLSSLRANVKAWLLWMKYNFKNDFSLHFTNNMCLFPQVIVRLLGLYWYYYYFSFTDHLQNFWSTADRFTSPWLPGAPANLLAPVSSKGEPTVRYRSYQGNSEEQIVEGGIRARKQIEMTQVNHRGLIGHTFSFWNGSECLWDGMLFSYILFFCR